MVRNNIKTTYFSYYSNLHTVVNKEDKICELCVGKTVLDLGCIDHCYDRAMSLGQNWLHKRIKLVARKVVGIDILSEDIKRLNQQGYNIIDADVEKLNLSKKFDVIVAGDLIEHLSNIGLFLQRVKIHMNKNSVVIISTPNPFSIEQFLSILFDNRVAVNPEHTVWLDPKVMFETTRRAGLKVVDFYWIRTRFGCHVQRFFWASTLISFLFRKFRLSFERDYLIVLKLVGRNRTSDSEGKFQKQ